MPFLSFIVPVYNLKDYLPDCIERITALAFSDWEIILIDDKSDDGSEHLCDRYAARDPRISAVHMSTNVGPGRARNEGLHRATGQYVHFVDGDDSLSVVEYPKFVEFISKCDCPDMVRIGYAVAFGRMPADGDQGPYAHRESVHSVEDFLHPLLRHRTVGFRAWEFVIKRSMLVRFGLKFNSARVWEDNDFIMRSLFAADRIGDYGRVLYHWRTRLSGSLTSSHIRWWDQIVASAVGMLEFACENALSDLQKEWALRCVHSCIVEFEAIAGGVPAAEVSRRVNLFMPFEKHIMELKKYTIENGLLWHIERLRAREGAVTFCRQKVKEACSLVSDRDKRELFGFPASHKCSRLLSVLGANGIGD